MAGRFRVTRGRVVPGVALLAGIGALTLPGSALAGEVSVVDGLPQFDAYAGEVNHVQVAELAGPLSNLKVIRVRDTNPIDRNADCAFVTTYVADCTVPLGADRVRAGLGNGDDSFGPAAVDAPHSVRFSVEGDLGDDTLVGTPLDDVLDGVGGDDTILGRAGNDDVQGANGDDTLAGEAGDDTLTGGNGNDRLTGGVGRDAMYGEDGDDRVDGADHAGGDLVDCGESWWDDDLGIYNAGDIVRSNCERTILQP